MGNAEVGFDIVGVVFDVGHQGEGALVALEFKSARVRVMNLAYAVVETPAPAGSRGTFPWQSEVLVDETFEGSAALERATEKGTYRILAGNPREPLLLRAGSALAFRASSERTWLGRETSDPGYLGDQLNRSIEPTARAGALQFQARANLVVDGPSFAFLYGGMVTLRPVAGEPRSVKTGEFENKTRTAHDSATGTGLRSFDRVVVVIEGDAVTTTIGHPDPGLPIVALRGLSGALDGDLTLGGAAGDLTVAGHDQRERQEMLQVVGNMTTTATFDGEDSYWTARGPASFVGIDGLALRGARNAGDAVTAIAAAGATALLAVLWSFLTQSGREFLTFVTGRNVTEPLSSKVRGAMLKEIAASPGITLSSLAQRFGMTSWGARYHIGVLKRGALIDEVTNGNTFTYMLNGHSFRFYAEGATDAENGDGSAKPRVFVADAMAELNHAKRRLIFDALRQAGPSSYEGLRATWKAAGVPEPLPTRSDVSFHAKKMHEAGLLMRRMSGRRTLWALNLDIGRVLEHQRRSYLAAPAVAAVFNVVRARPASTVASVAKACSGSLATRTRSRVEAILLQLEHVGVIARDMDGRYSCALQGDPARQ